MPEHILTVPVEATSYRPVFVHGNEYLAFPGINPQDGSLHSVNVLHMAAKGLIEFTGNDRDSLITPSLKVGNREVPFRNTLAWAYRDYWLPAFYGFSGDLSWRGIIYAPPGHRGAVYLLQVKNSGRKPLCVEAGFRVRWGAVRHSIFLAKMIEAGHSMYTDDWTSTLVLEAKAGLPVAALALGLGRKQEWSINSPGCAGLGQASSRMKTLLAPGEELSVPLYLAINNEGSGAGTTVVDLRRRGYSSLLDETREWLQAHSLALSKHQAIGNRNLFFNYFFALGRTVDTDELVPVTSRSPRYYVSAAFWSRDSLLWSFPGLLLVDKKTARETLLAVYSRHLSRAGEHAHYINGVLLYPGFELDQLAAYILALKNYLLHTGDITVLADETVKNAMNVITEKLLAEKDERTGLYVTFLDPSDDPVRYPFLIYDNALAERSLAFLAELQGKGEWQFVHDLDPHAASLRAAIYREGVVDGPLGPMFAWSVDGRGNYELYDNPPGSLQLLAHYGFCGKEDVVFQNTVRWVHSDHNPFYHARGPVRGAASRHAGNPWPLAAVNDLLSLDLDKGVFFSLAAMDLGLCCETVEPEKGRAATGHAFASAAGFMAYALWHAFGHQASGKNVL